MNLSVVICTYTEKRWDTLVAGITSVQQQSMPPYEIIVVSDNNPALAARLQAKFTGITVAENHGTPGISTARNVGVALASGDIVAFIDDDAIANKDWRTSPLVSRRVRLGRGMQLSWTPEEGQSGTQFHRLQYVVSSRGFLCCERL